ncbi:MAG: VCBS domain-containing protein, partial [Mycobacterium sp.]|nr:VCBS domain-containing protein [Mycobacterium sp.]
TAAATLTLSETDSTGSGSGSVGFSYSADDKSFEFRAPAETPTVNYDVTVTDNHTAASPQPVTITITGTNDAPVLAADTVASHAITEQADLTNAPITTVDTTSGSLSFTDVDLTDTHVASQAAPTYLWSGGTLTTAQTDALTAAATLTLSETDSTGSGSGSVGFSYSADDKSFDFLAAGETLTVTYNVTVADYHDGVATGTFSTQPVTIVVTGTNDAPVLAADAVASHAITEQAGGTGDLTATGATVGFDTASGSLSFTDADLNDTHTVSQAAPSYVWSGGTLTTTQTDALTAAATLTLSETDSTHSGTGSVGFSYSADDASFDFLAAGETLTVTYDVTVTDNHNVASTQPVTITITGTNDAPTIGDPSSASVTDNTDVDINGNLVATGSISINDPDHDQSLFQTAVTAAEGDLGSLSLNADGTYAYTVANSAAEYLAAGEAKVDTFTVTSLDGTTRDVTFTINGANEAPVITSAPQTGTVSEGDDGSSMTATGQVTYSDVDISDTHAFAVSAAAAYGTASVDANGVWHYTVNDSGAVDALAVGETLADSFTVQVDDHHGGLATQVVDITINGTNDVPVITSAAQSGTVSEGDDGSSMTATGQVTYSDVDTHDTHAFTVSAAAAYGAASVDANGVWHYTVNDSGAVDALAVGETLADSFTVQVDDHHGGLATQVVDITINGTNDAPVINTDSFSLTSGADTNGNPTTTISGLTVSDPDAKTATEMYTLTASTAGAPETSVTVPSGSGLLADVNAALATGVTYDQGASPPATDKVTVTVADGFGASDTVNFIFNIASHQPTDVVTLTGTAGKDVIFATGYQDILTGGAGADQFVFAPNTGNDTITDFAPGQDHIDLRALSNVVDASTLDASWLASHVSTQGLDSLITLDSSNTITLQNVAAGSLHVSDFIVSPHHIS